MLTILVNIVFDHVKCILSIFSSDTMYINVFLHIARQNNLHCNYVEWIIVNNKNFLAPRHTLYLFVVL